MAIEATVLSLLVDPNNTNVVYAGSNGDGVYKSIDGGGSFTAIGSPKSGIVYSLAKTGDRLYAGTHEGGVSVSRDGGETWRNAHAAEGRGYSSAPTAKARSTSAPTSRGFRAIATAGATGSDSAGRSFGPDCACVEGFAVAIDPSDRERVYLTASYSGLLVTEDGGRTWKDGGRHGFTATGPTGIAIDPRQPRASMSARSERASSSQRTAEGIGSAE